MNELCFIYVNTRYYRNALISKAGATNTINKCLNDLKLILQETLNNG